MDCGILHSRTQCSVLMLDSQKCYCNWETFGHDVVNKVHVMQLFFRFTQRFTQVSTCTCQNCTDWKMGKTVCNKSPYDIITASFLQVYLIFRRLSVFLVCDVIPVYDLVYVIANQREAVESSVLTLLVRTGNLSRLIWKRCQLYF